MLGVLYSCDEPAYSRGGYDPDRPSNVGDLEDAPVECEQGELRKDRARGVEHVLHEEVQHDIPRDRGIAHGERLIMDAKAEMNP